MSMKTDLERYQAAGLAATHFRQSGEGFVRHASVHAEALKKNPDAHVEFWDGLNEKGVKTRWTQTVAPDGTVLASTNEVFPCPPFCGPGGGG